MFAPRHLARLPSCPIALDHETRVAPGRGGASQSCPLDDWVDCRVSWTTNVSSYTAIPTSPNSVLVLVVFGGSQIPKLARNLGQAQREFRSAMSDSDEVKNGHQRALNPIQMNLRLHETKASAAVRADRIQRDLLRVFSRRRRMWVLH